MRRNPAAALRQAFRYFAAGVVLTLVISVLNIPAALAQGFQIEIPIDTILDTDDFITVELARVDVPPDVLDQECTATSIAINQESTREGNDILVESGGSQVVIPNVEAQANATIPGQGTLILGPEIVVSIRLGDAGEFSGGLLITVECEPVEPEPGNIIVVKEVTDGSDPSVSFDFTATYDADGFSLSDGEQNDSGDLAAGTYSVSESVPAGWTLESATCSDQSPVGAIELSAGETVTCTFVNDENPPDSGRIVVVKEVVDGSSTSQTFDFTSDYDPGEFSLSDGQQHDSGDLTAGIYSVDESVPPGWRLVSATCDDQSPVDAIDLSEGETVTCTFVNEQILDDVLASILVTISALCEVDGDLGVGRISVGVSVDGGADVTIRSSAGEVIATVSSDTVVTVPEGATYSWEAVPNDGFEFPAGSATAGTVNVETCSDVETLPFTGPETESLVLLASALVAGGIMMLHLASRKLEE